MNRFTSPTVILLILSAILSGCGGQADLIKPPAINASAAANTAMEMFDKDSNGQLEGDELDASPGIKSALKAVDTNSDNSVSKDELSARIQTWIDSKAGTLPASCYVTLRGRPVDGAMVTLEPEPFLADWVKPATGTTQMGAAELESVKFGMQVGMYRVKISKIEGGKEKIPAKYNENTTLGAEITSASPAVSTTQGIHFKLK